MASNNNSYGQHQPPPAFPPPPPHPLPPSGPQLAPGWVQTVDPVSSRPYYANPATGQTSWEPPLVPPPPPHCPPPPPPPPPPPQTVQQHGDPLTRQNQYPQHRYQPQTQLPPQLQSQQLTSANFQNLTPVPPGQLAMPYQHPPPQQAAVDPRNFQTQNIPFSSAPKQQVPQNNHIAHAPTGYAVTSPSPLGPSTSVTQGLLVPSVRSMMEADHAQKLDPKYFAEKKGVSKIELDGLTAGAIADLCNVSKEWRSRNIRVHGGDFANNDEEGNFNDTSAGRMQGREDQAGDAVNQYYLPLDPISLPVGSRPPHIEPGRVDIRLHSLYNKLNRI